MMYYNDGNEEYISRRLKNTYVLDVHKNVVFVSKIHKLGDKIYATILTPTGTKEVNLELLDLSPIKLGWINFDRTCSFFMRMPIRGAYQQGTSDRNTTALGELDVTLKYIDLKDIQKTVDNNYPNFYKATTMVEDLNYKKVAFSRNFAISKHEIFYKGVSVGVREHRNVKFNKQNEYLGSILERVVSK